MRSHPSDSERWTETVLASHEFRQAAVELLAAIARAGMTDQVLTRPIVSRLLDEPQLQQQLLGVAAAVLGAGGGSPTSFRRP